MLSCEQDIGQRIWSISDYLEPNKVKEAFQLPDDAIDTPFGIAPNQPSTATEAWHKIGKLWLVFCVILTGLQLSHFFLATNQVAFEKIVEYTTKPEGSSAAANQSTTTEPFTLSKNNSNVEIDVQGNNVDNSWLYLYGELVNDDTDETFSFEKTIEYYHGYESGDSKQGISIPAV